MLACVLRGHEKRGKRNATGMCTPAVRGLALKDHPMRAEACRMLADTEFTARNDKHLNAHRVQDLFRWMLPLCYRIIPTQAQPARSRLLRVLVFLLRYRPLGLRGLVNKASLNQRAVGSTPTRPTTNQPFTHHSPSSRSPCRHSVGSKTEKIYFSVPPSISPA